MRRERETLAFGLNLSHRPCEQASAKLDYAHLNGVDHVLKEDITKSTAALSQSLPFSAQLRAALKNVPGQQPLSARMSVRSLVSSRAAEDE